MRGRVVPVFFDFACPWSYAARAREKRLQRDAGVRFAYVPWELAPDLPPEGAPNPYAEPGDALVAYAAEAGVDLRPRARLANTRRALRGLHHARAQGAEEAYVDRCFAAAWEEGRDLHDGETLRRVARESGLDEEALLRAADDASWDVVLAASDAWAEQLGVETTVTYALPAPEGGLRIFQGLGSYEETLGALAPRRAEVAERARH